MSAPIKLLVVEDSQDDYFFIVNTLQKGGLTLAPQRVSTEKEMLLSLESPWDVVISDFVIPGFGGLIALQLLKDKYPDTPLIMVSGSVSEEMAVRAMKAGASDYVTKDNFTRLIPAIQRELREAKARHKQREMAETIKERDEQLRQAQKMEAVGRLAGGIAHDFKNILSIILMTCDSAQMSLPEDNPARRELGIIIRASERAAALTKQLLAFSREQVLELRPINLNHVVTEMEQMLRRLMGDTIKFSLNLDSNVQLCELDSGQMNQILLNLVLNARDAMPEGGKLTIETSNINLDQRQTAEHPWMKPGPHVQITIRDTGAGIAPELITKIFDPFFTTKGIGQGTGLGLFTTYGIVKQSRGSVTVTSQVGEGSLFRIYFPTMKEQTFEPAREITAVHPEDCTGTVLIVEDEVELRQALRMRLERSGLDVIEVETSLEALALIKNQPGKIDLIVADVVMPEMSGPDLIKAVREVQPAIKTLLTSGYLSDTMEKYGVVTDFSHFIAKPFKPDDFVAKVIFILQNEAAPLKQSS